MNSRRWTPIFWIAVLLVAWAAQDPLWLELSSQRVLQTTNAKGEVVEVFEPAADVAPGDVLEWRLVARNRSDATLEDVALIVPIPAGTAYLPGSARALELDGTTVEPEFSFDGGAHFARPPLVKRVVVEKDGVKQEVEVEVEPEAYTHVRWLVPALAPGQSVTVQLRTRVR